MRAWDEVIDLYADARNEALLEGNVQIMHKWMPDAVHRKQWESRLDRIRLCRQQRIQTPLLHETRMRLIPVKQTELDVIVDAKYKQLYVYEQYEQEYTEQIVEQERLWLKQREGRWNIQRIVPMVAERGSSHTGKQRSYHPSQRKHPNTKHYPQPAKPLINDQTLNAMKLKRVSTYDRLKAVQYANRWWNRANPDYIHFDVDCTNYVSQCLFAGGAPMNYTGNRATGWWYRHLGDEAEWSFSWSVSNSLYWYLKTSRSGLRAELVASPMDLELGDVIIYDWDGNNQYQHSTIVTAFDGDGMPLVNAHTTNSRHRYWDYKDSYAWSERTVYRFFHIL